MSKFDGENERQGRRGLHMVVSLVLHALLAAFLLLNPSFDPSRFAREKKPLEVELVDPDQLLRALQPPEPIKGQIVEQDEKAINDETPKGAKFMSRHNQKVVRETQAAVHGKFKNSDGTAGEKTPERKAGKSQPKQGIEADKDVAASKDLEVSEETLTAADGVGVKTKPKLKDLMPSFKPAPPPAESDSVAKGGGQQSATDDHLKNVATGMQTLLSTREFVYYSYYNRIKDKLRQYWEPKIKEKMERILRQGRTIASNTDRITRIVIVLDKSGTLVRVQVVGPSGVSDLDEAAIEAFRAAAPFPNPPKGIVDADGTIKIRWDFILEANASNMVRAFRLARNPY